MFRAVAAALSVALCWTKTCEGFNCQKSFSSPHKASFNLNPMIKKGNDRYTAQDAYFTSKRPFSYVFNVCGDVTPPQTDADCDAGGGAGPAAAYQLISTSDSPPSGKCTKLGRTAQYNWELVDGDNALTGVQLVYRNGDRCTTSNKERLFKIRFMCTREETALAPVGTVSEDDYCEYTIDLETVHGCPTQCHSSDKKSLCSQHGICAIDSTLNAARCFCNKGWMGDICNTPNPEDEVTSSSSVTSALMTLVMILLVALLALAAVLYVKIKKLNAEDNPYGAFEDQVPHSAIHGIN